MSLYTKNRMNLNEKAALENAFAGSVTNAINVEDLMAAVVELGELFAEQDDALVELAGMITEEGE